MRMYVCFLAVLVSVLVRQAHSTTGPPRITLAPKSQQVAEEAKVSFFCKASGNPAPAFYWEKGNKRINPRRNRYLITEVPHLSVLRIDPVKSKRDDATFTCVANNGQGEARANATLRVYKKVGDVDDFPVGYPRILVNPSLKSVEKGHNAIMQCEAAGTPEPTILWLKDHVPVDMSDPRITLLDSGYLQITNSQESDAGRYECVAENAVGVAYSYAAMLYVKVRRVPPHFSIPPEDIKVMPGSDVNLTCVAVGSPMPFVKWREGARELTDEDDLPVGRNILQLKDVRKSKNYTCIASSDLGNIEAMARVIVEAPGSPPRNVRARAASSTTIIVSWNEPEIPNGIIQGYKVFYTLHPEKPIFFWDVQDVTNDNKLTTISGLEPNETYTISALAYSGIGQGPMSHPIQVLTTQGVGRPVPYQPLNLHADPISANEIEVMWDAPTEADSIQSYELYYNDSHFRQNIRISIKPPIEKYKLTDLTPDTVYHIQVSAKSERGEGPKTPTIQVKTKMFVPGEPRKVRTEAINSTAMFVEWRPPKEDDRNGIIRGYLVYFYEVDSNDELVVGSQPLYYDTYVGTKHEAVITGLDPNTRYMVRVAAYTRKGDGIRSKPRVITTKGAVPSPPRNLHVELQQEDPPLIKVTWQIPRETHGPLKNYKIIWGHIGERYEEMILPSERYSFLTYPLDKGMTYEFRVSAKNDVDYGERAVETLRTPDGAPAGAPQNFTATGISETSLRLTWDLPARRLRNGDIAMYQITYHKLSDPINGENLNVTDTFVDISGLEMNTDYRFKIKAYTSKGSGPWSNNLHFRTFGYMPPAPKNVKARQTSSTTIEVTWDEPDFPVAGYKIYYNMFVTPVMDVWQALETGPYTLAVISGLESHTVYAVRVQAKSIDGRYGNLSEIVTTESNWEFPKDVVQNFRVTLRTSNMVKLSWDPPQKPGVSSYQLKYEGVKNYWENGVIKQIYQAKEEVRIAGQMTTWSLPNLQPKMKYDFNISAIFQDSTVGEDQNIIVETLTEA